MKLLTSDDSNRFQPSTKTNSIILNGSAIIIGDTITIPIDIKIVAITMSIIRNGINTKNPIWNAVLISLMT